MSQSRLCLFFGVGLISLPDTTEGVEHFWLFTFRTVCVSLDYLALLFGNRTRSGAAVNFASSFLMSLVLTLPASFGFTR